MWVTDKKTDGIKILRALQRFYLHHRNCHPGEDAINFRIAQDSRTFKGCFLLDVEVYQIPDITLTHLNATFLALENFFKKFPLKISKRDCKKY